MFGPMTKKVNNENVLNYWKEHWLKQRIEIINLRKALKSVLDQFVPVENFSSIEARTIAVEARKVLNDNCGKES